MVTEQSSHASLWRAECLYWPASSGMYSPHANSLQMPSAHCTQQCHPTRPDTHTHTHTHTQTHRHKHTEAGRTENWQFYGFKYFPPEICLNR